MKKMTAYTPMAQICTRNETLCLAVYGTPEEEFFMASCWDPSQEEGRYNASNGCSSGLHCWHMEDGTQVYNKKEARAPPNLTTGRKPGRL
jgi:hypothetical protein